jgi:hypothetical protein
MLEGTNLKGLYDFRLLELYMALYRYMCVFRYDLPCVYLLYKSLPIYNDASRFGANHGKQLFLTWYQSDRST